MDELRAIGYPKPEYGFIRLNTFVCKRVQFTVKSEPLHFILSKARLMARPISTALLGVGI